MQAFCPFFYDLTPLFLDLCQFVDKFRPIFADITPTGKLCFGDTKTPSPRQSYVFRSHMCHIDGHKVPHRQAASPTLATTRLFAAENDDEISLHSPVFAAAHFYLFHKNTSPPHLTPRKARYTKGLKPVRCYSNTSLTPH